MSFTNIKKLLVTFLLAITFGISLNPSPTFGGLIDFFSNPSPQQRRQEKQTATYKLQKRLELAQKNLDQIITELTNISAEKNKTNDPHELEMLNIRQKIAAEKLNAVKEEVEKIKAEIRRLKYM